ncbi:LacI family DNA-binding transcriptional regulator [Rugamonas sp.]|uniref:LacI family DNA-binding transcriptional regulator n=1 Tax=Rugamonas sp. TaxID=1926287 RepID=UPI0025D45079|nr:LacI family DNA-binding transcriptional regulator [Rugamonas sp.]
MKTTPINLADPADTPSPRAAHATVRDVARAAGVSTGTVSRALKNEPGLTESTRQMVLRTARGLGYDFAKLRPKRIRRLTFLLHRQHDTAASSPFYSAVLHGAEQACRRHGIVLSFMAAGPADSLADQLRMHAPDGLVCVGYLEPELLGALHATGKPLVLIDMKLRGHSSVNPDNLRGGHLATAHLIAQGRKRIGLIAGPLGHYSIRERARGYRQALFDAGILADPRLEAYLPDGADLEAGAREAMQALLDLPQRPDAVFCYNDSAALTALRCCREAGLRVPHDIAIAGFDDIAGAAQAVPPLTTLRIDKQALGALGVELLLAGPHAAPLDTVAPVELIIRASSAAPRTPSPPPA